MIRTNDAWSIFPSGYSCTLHLAYCIVLTTQCSQKDIIQIISPVEIILLKTIQCTLNWSNEECRSFCLSQSYTYFVQLLMKCMLMPASAQDRPGLEIPIPRLVSKVDHRVMVLSTSSFTNQPNMPALTSGSYPRPGQKIQRTCFLGFLYIHLSGKAAIHTPRDFTFKG